MTDHPGEPSSENSVLGSTSEPLASVEDQAWISGLLAGLATTDQHIPATIAAQEKYEGTGLFHIAIKGYCPD